MFSSVLEEDEYWMRRALELARRAEAADEVPVGALAVLERCCIGKGWNQPISSQDPTAHAEIVALRRAARFTGNYRLPGVTLYVTLEPCIMCIGALIHARIDRLVFGASDLKTGAVHGAFDLAADLRHNHHMDCLGGVLEEPCKTILQAFFKTRRKNKHK